MARYAILQDGIVTNVIEADESFASSIGAIPSETASPGDTYSNGQFSRPTPAPQVPDEVERWKAHYVLIQAGRMAAVKAAIAAIPDATQRDIAELLFYQRPTIRRIGGLTQQLQQAAGITDEERDAMFILAASL